MTATHFHQEELSHINLKKLHKRSNGIANFWFFEYWLKYKFILCLFLIPGGHGNYFTAEFIRNFLESCCVHYKSQNGRWMMISNYKFSGAKN